jgi:hypothetical protein
MVDKLELPFHLLSDPQGELIKHLGLWNKEEGVSEPTIVVLNKTRTVQYLYSGGTDFSDRPPEESLLEILDGVESDEEPDESEPEIRVSAEEAENETVRPDRPAMTLEQLQPMYIGAYYATVAMKKKFKDLGSEGRAASKKVSDYQKLVNEYNTAIKETVEAKDGSQPCTQAAVKALPPTRQVFSSGGRIIQTNRPQRLQPATRIRSSIGCHSPSSCPPS